MAQHNRAMAACSKCKMNPPRRGQRYCQPCHTAYVREHRARHSELAGAQRMRANVRAHANTAQRRGQLAKQPCEVCAHPDAEKHHPDYSRPLLVRWLCRRCHLTLHYLL
jgi:hypothetical protein